MGFCRSRSAIFEPFEREREYERERESERERVSESERERERKLLWFCKRPKRGQ